VAALSCKGCHLGQESDPVPKNGRFGAPLPEHVGLPTIHFEKMTCTACHSGRRPSENAQLVQTSQAHGLGTHGIHKSDEVLPYILSPVFVKGESGKIEPHHLMWPAYWAFMKGDSLQPIPPEQVRPIALAVIAKDTLTDSLNYSRIMTGKWPHLTHEQLTRALDSLSSFSSGKGIAVYISGGKLYRLTEAGGLTGEAHPAARPYSWAFAHDVRPAAQALGSQGCSDCHSVGAAFSFGKVDVHSPLAFERAEKMTMTAFQDNLGVYPRVFALTFLFRPLLKLVILLSCMVMAAVLLLYLFKGLDCIVKA